MNISRDEAGSIKTATVESSELIEIMRRLLEQKGYQCRSGFDVIIRFKTGSYSLHEPVSRETKDDAKERYENTSDRMPAHQTSIDF